MESPRGFLRLLACLLLWAASLGAENPDHKQVLILHSYHLGYVWTANIHEGLRDVLQGSRLDVDLRTEYLDWKHFPTEENLARQFETLRAKYHDHRFDLVITSDNKALEFVLEHRAQLFPGVPIVFCGYNGFRPDLLARDQNVTGVAEFVDGWGTVEMGLRLVPQTRRVWVVTDLTETGRAVRREVERSLQIHAPDIEARFIGEGLSTEEVLARVEGIPGEDMILVGPFNQDSRGRFLDLWELAELMRDRHVQAPVLHLYEEALGHGVLGGSLMSGRLQGEAAGHLAVRVLRGEAAGAIPVRMDATVHRVVDFKEMRRFGIPETRIPEGSEILNPPESFYARHKHLILGSLVVSILAVLALTGVLVARRQRELALRRSEARLRALVQNMPVLVCAFDEGGQIIVWNRACESASGYPAEEILGGPEQHAFDLMKAEDWFSVVRLARGTEAEPRAELELQGKDGRSRTVLWTSEARRFPIPGWAGWIVGIDVTEQRLAEAERARLALAVSQTVDGVLLASSDRTIAYVNAAAAAVFAERPEDMTGKRLDPYFAASAPGEGMAAIWQEIQAGRPWRGRLREVRPDGTERVLDALFSPIRQAGEPRPSAVVVVRDVTRQLELEDLLLRSQRMESLGALASGVAHDFGNLLTTILSSTDLLEMDFDDPTQRQRDVEVVRKTAQRGADLVRQLLGFARSRPSELTTVDFHRVLEELREMLARTLPKTIRIELDLRATRHCIQGDGGQILQVLLNLALNARDAMPSGGTLSFRTASADSQIHVSIQDTGTGMSPEVMARIFEPFYSTKGEGKGTGMGLAMAYALVKSHGGEIEVRSAPGKGTTFHLRFDAKACPAAEA